MNSIKIKTINFNNVINDNIFKKHKIFEINFSINDIFDLKKRFFYFFFFIRRIFLSLFKTLMKIFDFFFELI